MDRPSDVDVRQNGGRCDICGRLIEMDSGDRLVISDPFEVPEDVKADTGITDQDAADAVADALERVAESPGGYELAKSIRENGVFRTHGECIDETNYEMLEQEIPDPNA